MLKKISKRNINKAQKGSGIDILPQIWFNTIEDEKKYIMTLLKEQKSMYLSQEELILENSKRLRKFLELIYEIIQNDPSYDLNKTVDDYFKVINSKHTDITLNKGPKMLEQLIQSVMSRYDYENKFYNIIFEDFDKTLKCCCNDPHFSIQRLSEEEIKENKNHCLKKTIFKKYIESHSSDPINEDEVLSPISPASPVEDIFTPFREPWHMRQDRQWAKNQNKKMERDKDPYRQHVLNQNFANDVMKDMQNERFKEKKQRCEQCECCKSGHHHLLIGELYTLLSNYIILYNSNTNEKLDSTNDMIKMGLVTALPMVLPFVESSFPQVKPFVPFLEKYVGNSANADSVMFDSDLDNISTVNADEKILKILNNKSTLDLNYNYCAYKTLYEYIIEDFLGLKFENLKEVQDVHIHYLFLSLQREYIIQNYEYNFVFYDFEINRVSDCIKSIIYQNLEEFSPKDGDEKYNELKLILDKRIDNIKDYFIKNQNIRLEISSICVNCIISSYKDMILQIDDMKGIGEKFIKKFFQENIRYKKIEKYILELWNKIPPFIRTIITVLIAKFIWGYISSYSLGAIILAIISRYGINLLSPILNSSVSSEIQQLILNLLPEYVKKQINEFKDKPYIQKALKIFKYIYDKNQLYKLQNIKNYYYKDMILKDDGVILRKSYLKIPKEFNLALKKFLIEKVNFMYNIEDQNITILKKNNQSGNTIFYIENSEIKIKSGDLTHIEYIHAEQKQLNQELDKLLILLIKDPLYRLIYYLNDSSDDIKMINDKYDHLLQMKQRKLQDEMLGINKQYSVIEYIKPIEQNEPKTEPVVLAEDALLIAEKRKRKILDRAADRMERIMGIKKLPLEGGMYKNKSKKKIINSKFSRKNRINL